MSQLAAERFVKAEREKKDLERQIMDLNNQMSNLVNTTTECSVELLRTVGNNIPNRVYVIGDTAILVQHKVGVTMFPIVKP